MVTCRLHWAMVPVAVVGCVLVACGSGDSPSSDSVGTTSEAVVKTPRLGDFALYAERSIKIGAKSEVAGGDVGVAARAAPDLGAQLAVGAGTFVQRGTLVSASVSLDRGALVARVLTNSLLDNGAHVGHVGALPTTMPALPLAVVPSEVGTAITVKPFEVVRLTPGVYGALTLRGTARLRAGTYSFSSIVMGDGARLLAEDGGVNVRVATTLSTGRYAQLTMDDGCRSSASGLAISVSGYDSDAGSAVKLGAHDRVHALLMAPHGTISLADETTTIGALAAYDIVAGARTRITFEEGFSASASGQQGTQQLSGYGSASGTAALIGPVPPSTPMRLTIGLPPSDLSGLAAKIRRIYDPLNPEYRRFLTPEEFAKTHGPAPADYQALLTFARANGFEVAREYTSHQLVSVTATAADVQKAFHVSLNMYQRPERPLYAPDREPSLDLKARIWRIDGLDSLAQPLHADGTGPIDPTTNEGMYIRNDFRTAYFPGVTLTGKGQSVAIVAFADYDSTAIDSFETSWSPPLNVPVMRVPVGSSEIGQDSETTLDVEAAVSMAPGLDGVFVYEGPVHSYDDYNAVAADVLTQIANPPSGITRSNQISCSWGGFGGRNVATALAQLVIQGQAFFQASGDSGPWGSTPPLPFGDHPDGVEAEVSLMTLVGGTQLITGPMASYQSETTWNDTQRFRKSGTLCLEYHAPACCSFACASGGASVANVPIPWYQQPIAAQIAAAGGDPTLRSFPDVSILATDIAYGIGTSASAPLWSGVSALVNEQAAAHGFAPIGFLNPHIYRIAQTPNYALDFHDIDDGSSSSPLGGPGAPFLAIKGYDLATGWGSPRGTHLLDDLAGITSPAVLSVTAGATHTCAILSGGPAECWGDEGYAQLGNGFDPSSGVDYFDPTPGVVIGVTDATSIVAGATMSCAVLRDRSVQCWGFFGTLGIGGTLSLTAVPVQGLDDVVDIALTNSGTGCATRSNGEVRCWGYNGLGQLGNPAITASSSTTPVQAQLAGPGALPGIGRHTIVGGNAHLCAILANGNVQCWGGGNALGQLGNGSTANPGAPVSVLGVDHAVALAAGYDHTCALMANGSVACWGSNALGQIGDPSNTTANLAAFVVPGVSGGSSVAAGGAHTCVVVSGGSIECWGSNVYGQLGLGVADNSIHPSAAAVQLTGSASIVVAGGGHTCAVLSGGTLACWGENLKGELGLGDDWTSQAPVALPTLVRFF